MKLDGQASPGTVTNRRGERHTFRRVRQCMIHLQRAVAGDDWVEAHDNGLTSMFRQQCHALTRSLDAAANEQLRAITGHAADWEDGADQATRAIRGLSTFERPVYAVLFTHREPA